MSILVVDVGTSGIRASIVRPTGRVEHVRQKPFPPMTPSPGLVEVDAGAMAASVLEVARGALAEGGPVSAVGIANQRATSILWERATGQPLGPGIGWQDLRTVGDCLALQSQGLRLAPNASATKLAYLLNLVDPDRMRARQLCFGTVDTWVAWTLSEGSLHVTDASNAAVTGMVKTADPVWSPRVLEALRIPLEVLPQIVDSSGFLGKAYALPGSPPITGICGDQQASLIGQGCTRPGLAKVTFGTGGMLDMCLGSDRPRFEVRGQEGTFPIVAWKREGRINWGLEAIMLTAGSAVDWLKDDIGMIDSAADSDSLAASCEDTGDVWFVPALMGMGTPVWDFGARGTLLGITRGTGRAEIARAVLEGVAHRGADLVDAAEADAGIPIDSLRVDGGMTANNTFVQALADACQRPVEVSPQLEATTLGAGYMAGLAAGIWGSEEEIAEAWSPRAVVEPLKKSQRERWIKARERSLATVPEFSALQF